MASTGERVGEYLLESKIGQGAFGEVWRAKHHVWADRVVAVKVPTDGEYVRMLQREGAAIHGLDHVNVVKAINFDPYASPPYLAMELVPGVSLRGLLQQRGGRLHYREAAQILGQVLGGLAYAHGMGIVHRDVKPENVLVHERALAEGFAEAGLVKLTDFGLGQKASEAKTNSIAYTASIEQGSALAGTIAYMSPEQRSGLELDARSDLYSCGVMLFEMITGERPAGTELPSELQADLPKGLDDVFRRAYARLAMRYANAGEFAAALARATSVTPPPLPGRGVAALSVGVSRMGAAAATVAAGVEKFAKSVSDAKQAGGAMAGPACTRCHKPVAAGDQFCMSCGYQLVDRVRRCTSCGAYPHAGDKYCLVCGRDLPGGGAAGGSGGVAGSGGAKASV